MTIALNILFVPHNTKQIKYAYKSKYNHKRNILMNLLMLRMNELASNRGTMSKITPRLDVHVKKVT